MKHSLPVKFVAVVLCALTLLTALVSGGALLFLSVGLNGQSFADYWAEDQAGVAEYVAKRLAFYWTSGECGEMPEELVLAQMEDARFFYRANTAFCTILDEEGEERYSDYNGQETEPVLEYHWDSINYERFYGRVGEYPVDDPKVEGAYNRAFFSQHENWYYNYWVTDETDGPGCTVRLYLAADASKQSEIAKIMLWADSNKSTLTVTLAASLLLFAAFAVYLCSAAGHKPGREEIKAGGLNALPLDLYGAAAFACVTMAIIAVAEGFDWWTGQSWQTLVLLGGLGGYALCLLFVGFCFAFVAQIKTPRHYWWWNSLCGRCLRFAIWVLKKCGGLLLWAKPKVVGLAVWSWQGTKKLTIWVWQTGKRILEWCWRTGLRILRAAWKVSALLLTLGWQTWQKIWNWIVRQTRKGLRWAGHFYGMLPLTWQWLVVGFGLLVVLAVPILDRWEEGILLGLAICAAVVIYGSHSFGTLLGAVKKLRSGDMEAKVDGKYLVGCFREFSEELNGLADVAMVAAQKQLKSERMKTELITNVSHDIKTPLTSIINYVDLMQMPHNEEQEKMYLEVLSRQSQRMKKLIEDLMEMSKASTGNIAVEITEIDGVEAANQALGEFADKLEAAGLTIVFHQPEEPVVLLADGRLLWRAMSNLLSNAVKYAMPGTRLYVDVTAVGEKALISFKNISGAQLNITADELMERFVRGDSSRNTEGSGLGLNIAKSLMELQKGQLQLLVDGDLFKVTLVFPRAPGE